MLFIMLSEEIPAGFRGIPPAATPWPVGLYARSNLNPLITEYVVSM